MGKLERERKEKMRESRRAERMRNDGAKHHRGEYTGSAEEKARGGHKLISKQFSVGLDDNGGEEEEDLLELVRRKQVGRQSWQDLDAVPSKLKAMEEGTASKP